MTRSRTSWAGRPAAQQSQAMVGEFQELDGSWSRVAGPGPVMAVIHELRRWRESQAAEAETRVRELRQGEEL